MERYGESYLEDRNLVKRCIEAALAHPFTSPDCFLHYPAVFSEPDFFFLIGKDLTIG